MELQHFVITFQNDQIKTNEVVKAETKVEAKEKLLELVPTAIINKVEPLVYRGTRI